MLTLIIITTLVSNTMSGVTDLNCTSFEGGIPKYNSKATNCANKYPDVYCTALFGPDVVVGMDNERPTKCFQETMGKNNEEVKMLAISACPKTCGYCCLTPAYNCPNKRYPRIQCERVTTAMCNNAIWRPIIAEDCPNICGFCEESNCKDEAPYCPQFSVICRLPNLESFARRYCRRTCGFCNESSGSANCGNHASCPIWIRNNFCTNTFYTPEQKRKYCGIPCKLC